MLDVIHLFDQQQVVHLGIEPQPTDAHDPASATNVTPRASPTDTQLPAPITSAPVNRR